MELKQELVDSTTYFRYITRRYCLRWAFPHIFQRVSRRIHISTDCDRRMRLSNGWRVGSMSIGL